MRYECQTRQVMEVSYEVNGLKKTDLKELAGISKNTLAKLDKYEYIVIESIDLLCQALNCNFGDTVDIARKEALHEKTN